MFTAVADDHELLADGADRTRIGLPGTDKFDPIRLIANGPIGFELSGPAVIIGGNPFSLVAGPGAIWIHAVEEAGLVTLRATHSRPGTRQVEIRLQPALAEFA
jgi:beta-galactosidase